MKKGDRPIGVFDSGLGGLTVLAALRRALPRENFIYFGDTARVPYGTKSPEAVRQFSGEITAWLVSKGIKTLVVACNTATAYGLEDITTYLEESGSGIKAIGVINAGVNATLDKIRPGEDAAIGILATVGTIASQGYEKTFGTQAGIRGHGDNLMVVSHGSFGFAEAVDGERDFADKDATGPGNSYRGPSLDHPQFRIERDLLPAYGFDFSSNKMLYEGLVDNPLVLQLNAPENYARYH
ncbi:MAG TPA: aspartate/glutamate racemase family protein, partial [Elusimicrobiales bacterium]|nr:aspartate/glutamate racemase family protein [Elusimicrobiales bacterium]